MAKRWAVTIPAAVIAAAVACSDSSGPHSSSGPISAARIDVLYQQACSAADTVSPSSPLGDAYNKRCSMFALLLAAPASGATPSLVHVVTLSGTQTWYAVVVAESDTANGAVTDSSFFFVAYSDTNVTDALVSVFTATTGGFVNLGSALFTAAPLDLSSATNGVAIFTTATGAPCADVSGLKNPLNVPIQYEPPGCHLATFNVQVGASFPATPGLDTALQAITIEPQTVNGVHLINTPVYEQRVMR